MRNLLTLFVLFAALAVARPAQAEQYFDLGGPCQNHNGLNTRAIAAAKASGAWDRVVELQKLDVRARCDIEYRWHRLVTALLGARREREAAMVLQEMDSRGFSTSPSMIARMHPEVGKFFESPQFLATPAGRKMEASKKVSMRGANGFAKS